LTGGRGSGWRSEEGADIGLAAALSMDRCCNSLNRVPDTVVGDQIESLIPRPKKHVIEVHWIEGEYHLANNREIVDLAGREIPGTDKVSAGDGTTEPVAVPRRDPRKPHSDFSQ